MLIAGGTYVVKSSGVTIQGQMWWRYGEYMFWDGVNWYEGNAIIHNAGRP